MKRNKYSIFLGILILSFILAGCGKNEPERKEAEPIDKTLVHDSTENVISLDVNKDSMVYQCPMIEHFNVISDKPGLCPLCKMDLEEIDVKQAAENFDAKYHGKPEEEQKE